VISIYGDLDIMMLIKLIGLSGIISYSLSTQGWRCVTKTPTTVAELLLVDGQGHGLKLWIFGKGHIPFLSGSKTIYSMNPHTSRVDVR